MDSSHLLMVKTVRFDEDLTMDQIQGLRPEATKVFDHSKKQKDGAG